MPPDSSMLKPASAGSEKCRTMTTRKKKAWKLASSPIANPRAILSVSPSCLNGVWERMTDQASGTYAVHCKKTSQMVSSAWS